MGNLTKKLKEIENRINQERSKKTILTKKVILKRVRVSPTAPNLNFYGNFLQKNFKILTSLCS